MRKIVAGNWKMNLGLSQSKELAQSLGEHSLDVKDTELWVAPSTQTLSLVCDHLVPKGVQVGGQNVHWEERGAFTGEVSAQMLKECGCTFSLIGHSERRHTFKEDDEMIAKRCKAALAAGLSAVLCIGETLEERESGKTNSVLEHQLGAAVPELTASELSALLIAYEPVWAIGTGKVASLDEISAAHTFIADYLEKQGVSTKAE